MNIEIVFAVTTAVSGAVGAISAWGIQWLLRPKTESEAEINEKKADKIQAESVTMMFSTIAKMSEHIETMLKAKIDNVSYNETMQRDIWTLQGESQRDKTKINELSEQVAGLLKSKAELETQVFELAKGKLALEKQVAGLVKSEAEKDGQIGLLRERIRVLENERDELRDTVQNGKPGEKEARNSEIIAKNDDEKKADPPVISK